MYSGFSYREIYGENLRRKFMGKICGENLRGNLRGKFAGKIYKEFIGKIYEESYCKTKVPLF